MAQKVADENKPKRKINNRASELRKETGVARRLKNDSSRNSLGLYSVTNTFS